MFSKFFTLFSLLLLRSNGLPLEDAIYKDGNSLSPRIVGGVEAPREIAKHMVALLFANIGWTPSLICGGSLISKKHVLTAAHCIEPFVIGGELSPSFKGVTGCNYWNSTKSRIEFIEFKLHPDWNAVTIKNDIAYLVSNDIVLDERTAIIPLSFDFIQGDVDSFVTGWGMLGTWDIIPYRLQMLEVTTITSEQCKLGIEEGANSIGNPPPFDPEVEICTLHSVNHGMCFGDSGSALISKKTGEQIGIVSWGFPCALGHPDMFVRVSAFKEFLNDVL